MDAHIKAALPAAVQHLVGDIEASVGVEIKFRRELPRGDPSPLATYISETAVPTILCRDLSEIPPDSLLHELLHIERYLVKGVPQLYPKDNAAVGAFEDIEDTLEHLVIVPREASYGFDPWEHETQQAKRQWNQFDPGMARSAPGKLACMKIWLPVHFLVRDKDVRNWVVGILKEHQLWALADRLASELEKKLDSKPAVASTFLRVLGIPRDRLRLLYFDVQNHNVRYEYVPEE